MSVAGAVGLDHIALHAQQWRAAHLGVVHHLLHPAEGRLGDIRFAGEDAVITSTPTAFDNFSMVDQKDIRIEDLFILLDAVC